MARPGLGKNRKYLRLVSRLRQAGHHHPQALAMGLLELLWHSAYEDGNPLVGDAYDVEARAGWEGEEGALVALLVEGGGGLAGFLDLREGGLYVLHDFWEHAPPYVRRRRDREQERKERCS